MKNKLIKIGIVVVAGASIFLIGHVVGAQTASWQDQVSVDAANQINQAAQATTTTLTTDVQDKIKQEMLDKASTDIDKKKAELEQLLQAYYDAKLNSVTSGPEYDAVLADLERIKNVYLDSYKAEIDKAFSGQ